MHEGNRRKLYNIYTCLAGVYRELRDKNFDNERERERERERGRERGARERMGVVGIHAVDDRSGHQPIYY